MDTFTIRGTSITDASGKGEVFASAHCQDAATFLVVADAQTHIVLLGAWAQPYPGAVDTTYYGGRDSSVVLTISGSNTPPVAYLPVHEILSKNFKPTRVVVAGIDDEWSEVPFEHDCPLRYLLTHAKVTVAKSSVTWHLDFRSN